jgi:hypothetical protein
MEGDTIMQSIVSGRRAAVTRFDRATAAVLMRICLAVTLIAGVPGCATQAGNDQASAGTPKLPSLGALTPGMGRIVVMRKEKGFVALYDRSFDIKLDGQGMGDLMTGGFVSADRPPGHHQVTAELWDIPGTTKHDVSVAAGHTYYLVAKLDEGVNRVNWVAMVSPAATLVGRAVEFGGEHGAIGLTALSEPEGKAALAALGAPQ